MNRMQGDSLDYLYWSYDGLSVEASKNAGQPLITDQLWSTYQTNWSSIQNCIEGKFNENCK